MSRKEKDIENIENIKDIGNIENIENIENIKDIEKNKIEKIVTKNFVEKINEKIKIDIDNAVKLLKKGGVVIFPTDTVYGLGAIPKKESIKKIYDIKRRSEEKKIIALVSSKETGLKLLSDKLLNNKMEREKIERIMDKFFPGDLTIICNANKEFTNKIDKNMETIGIRVPNNDIALKIIESAGGIVMTTSANISGGVSPIFFDEIDKEIIENVDYYVKNENEYYLESDYLPSDEEVEIKKICIKRKKPSTIISLIDGKIELLREGNILFDEILKY